MKALVSILLLPSLLTLAPVAAFAADQRVLAEQLIELFRVQENTELAVRSTIEQQIATNPQVAPYADVYREFARRYITWPDIKDDVIEVYANHFSAQELETLVTFFRSPVGRKFLDDMPELTEKVSARIQHYMAGYREDLLRMIADYELEALGPARQ